MQKIVFPMFSDDVGKGLVGMTPVTAVELGAEVGTEVIIRKGDKSVTVKVKTYPGEDLNPDGILLDMKTRKKLGVRTTDYMGQSPDFVDVEKA